MSMRGEKKRTAFTAADVVIVVLLLLLGFFIYRYTFADTSGDGAETEYVVRVSAIRTELSDRVSADDEVYSKDGEFMGRVISCTAAAAIDPETGRQLPDQWTDLYITIDALADGDGKVSGMKIAAERELELYTKGLFFKGVVVNVRG